MSWLISTLMRERSAATSNIFISDVIYVHMCFTEFSEKVDKFLLVPELSLLSQLY